MESLPSLNLLIKYRQLRMLSSIIERLSTSLGYSFADFTYLVLLPKEH